MFEVSQYKYSGQSSTTIYNVVQGSQTTYLYFLEYLSTSGTGVVRKESMDGNQAWLSAYSGKPSSSSLAISADENYVYYSVYTSPVPVIQINSSTGSCQSVIQFSSFGGSSKFSKIYPTSDNLGYYLFGYDQNSPYLGVLCKYLFSISSSTNCQFISNLYHSPTSFTPISTNDFIFGRSTAYSPYNMIFKRISFGQTQCVWSKYAGCVSGSCDVYYSQVILSSDSSLAYTVSTYYYSTDYYAYFITFNSTDGSINGGIYLSSVPCLYASLVYKEIYLVMAMSCNSKPVIMLYNLQTSLFSYYYGAIANAGILYKIIVVGIDSNNYGYLLKHHVEGVSVHPQFGSTSVSMSSISVSSLNFVSESSSTLSLISSYSVAQIGAYTNQTVTYQLMNHFAADVSVFKTSESFLSLTENNYYELSIVVSCTISGLTSISYSLGSYNGEIVPSWVAINSTAYLVFTTPRLTSTTDYSFYVNSYVASAALPIQKLVTLRVNVCSASNCSKCKSNDYTMCEICALNYTLSQGNCVATPSQNKMSNTVYVLGISIKCAVAASIICVIISNLNSTSTLSSIWNIIGQLQLFYFILLTKAYFPDDIINLIAGSNYILLLYNSIQFNS